MKRVYTLEATQPGFSSLFFRFDILLWLWCWNLIFVPSLEDARQNRIREPQGLHRLLERTSFLCQSQPIFWLYYSIAL